MSEHNGGKKSGDAGWELDRRAFMRLLAMAGAAACAPITISGCGEDKQPTPTFRVRVRRPEDLLCLDISLINLLAPSGLELKRVDEKKDAFVVFDLPPQHVMERVLREGNAQDEALAPPFHAYLSGPTRLVFRMPDDVKSVTWELEPLLEAVQGWELSVSEHALPRPGASTPQDKPGFVAPDQVIAQKPSDLLGRDTIETPQGFSDASAAHRTRQGQHLGLTAAPAEPGPPTLPDLDITAPSGPGVPEKPASHETSIELPTRLIISPHRQVRFVHAVTPETSQKGRVALWHTQMVPLGTSGAPDPRNTSLSTIRALWARGPGFDPDDPSAGGGSDPFPNPLTPGVRAAIVHQSSNYEDLRLNGKHVPPEPVQVDKLLLTALGAYFDAHAQWGAKDNVSLSRWLANTSLGRDHYVEYAELGYLYPYGHDAVLVTVSQREIRKAPAAGGGNVAALTQFSLLVLQDLSRDFAPTSQNANVQRAMRAFPFARVRFRERMSPRLTPPNQDGPYRPRIGATPYALPASVLDREMRPHDANLHVVWVPGRPDQWSKHAQAARGAFSGGETVELAGARIAYAPASADGESRYETHRIELADVELNPAVASQAGFSVPFVPQVREARVALEAARAMVGHADAIGVAFSERFLDEGFGAGNPGQLLFEFLDGGVDLAFGKQSDKSGGFLSPDFSARGISRLNGLVGGDLTKIASGTFDPASFLGGMLPKLFGAIPLTSILDAVGVDLSRAPRLVSQGADEIETLLADLGRMLAAGNALGAELPALNLADLAAAGFEQVEARIQAVQSALTAIVDKANAIATAVAQLDADFLLSPEGVAALPGLLDQLRDALDAALFLSPSLRAPLREAVERLRKLLAKLDPILAAIDALLQAQEMLETRTVRLEWRPKLKPDAAGFFVPHRPDGLVLGAEIRAKAAGGKPAGADIYCALEKFDLVILGANPVFTVRFDRIAFTTRAGEKPDIDVVLDDLVFGGPLRFIERIKQVLPLDGFSDPPAIDVDASGLRASFSIPLPNVSVGVFSLENLSIGAGFEIPFLGDSIALRFSFCSRENPFLLTVMMLGGGGFVGLELTPTGIRLLEVSLEFGASLAVDFGVASGGVSIVAGIYICVEQDAALLTGYLRFRGYVQVLGIIGASITLAMELSYRTPGNKVIGKAELIIEVTVLCFSASVKLTAERKFAGGNEDPTFADAMAPVSALDPVQGSDQPDTPWATYVNAFA